MHGAGLRSTRGVDVAPASAPRRREGEALERAPRWRCVTCGQGDPNGTPWFCSMACRLRGLGDRCDVLAGYRQRLGGSGVAGRGASARQLVELTRAEANFATQLLASGAALPSGLPPLHTVSPHLWVVMLLAGDGFENKEIGQLLSVSPHTVRKYVSTLLSRLGMRNRAELAAFVGGLRARLQFAPDSVECLFDRRTLPRAGCNGRSGGLLPPQPCADRGRSADRQRPASSEGS
jgi:hypothetical protein